ncbi:MAG TPA: LCP family protein [Candidatus Saccharimonadales bacterium]|nr:LCP family protein [Candidatus Saccharimonadales bacterium]
MHPKKYDSFSPKRATNIDGFFAKNVEDRPRRPVFSAPAAKPQPEAVKLTDMPKRSQPQAVLSSAVAVQAQADKGYSLEGGAPGERRRRPVGPEEPEGKGKRSKKERRPRSWKRIVKRTVLIAGALVLIGGGWFGYRFYRDISKLTGNSNPLSLLGAFVPAPLQNDEGRVNILVAANSADDPGHNGGNLTDSIMVLSVNTKNNTALMLSIPRDLWVNIPGSGHAKINSAFTHGGMNTLQEVVQDSLGLTIHYTALVNYGAFRDLVDAVGGITITIKSGDSRGIYDPSLDYTTRHCCALAKYPNGPANLNGHQALDLARARGDAYGSYGYDQADFTRTMYQRKMLLAVKDKSSQSSVIANPFKVASLVDAVGNNVKTDLKVNEIETLYTYMKKIDDSKVDSYNLNTLKGQNTTMLANYATPDGQSALIPAAGIDDFTDIQKQLNKVFTADPVSKEGATTVVLNGTSTSGLALAQENKLIGKGMTVAIGDAPVGQPATTIIDNSNGEMPNTLAYLKQQYKATVVTNASLTRTYYAADFIVILGESSVPKTTATTAQ